MKPSDFLTELSNDKLTQYKTAAAADASKADKEGDFKKGDKRFSGIVKATKKQFDNDAKKDVAEGASDDDEYGPKAREEWLKQQAYEKKYNKKKPSTPVNPANKSKEQGVAEMHSQSPKGRMKPDGTRSHSTYGSRDHYSDSDPQHTAKPTTAKKTTKQAADILNKAFKDEHKKGVAEEKCPHCNGPMVSEELINEKKDACYYKVKSRYKVWPSAYASGALVKCRNKGASNWGNGGKKNESSILEGIEQADESLHDWFNKEKWVRMDTKGNIKGPCAKEPGEGKPKCLPQAKAHSLGKKGRASAAARKRREDPNPDRSGKAINVNTKKTKG